MRISQALRRFHLHDSWVDAINYLPDMACLEIVLDLCDWGGDDDDSGDVFGQSGRLVFYEVEGVETDLASLSSVQDCEILNLEHKPGLDVDDLEAVWGVFDLHEQDDDGAQRVVEITFLAFDFDWFPES